jgi:arylsulfatase A-like enzyme/uncharacterized protein YuzE
MKRIILALLALSACNTKPKQEEITSTDAPKLVVGVVVDQMRYDYLTKYVNHYSENGFKRLVREGYNLENAHYNFIPTKTAVGHASIFTGATPADHGIIANDWYDRFESKSVYCVDDFNFETIGASSGGQKSPKRMQTTTLSDQLNLDQNFRGKVIGIAIKDRSSILPAGHTANAAYWFVGKDLGHFISSSYYMAELPNWVTEFNAENRSSVYLNAGWDTYSPIETYIESTLDNNSYEGAFNGKDKAVFPYDLKNLKEFNGNLDLIKETPFGNSITTDFALAAITQEKLGKGDFTDFLSISYSSTDYVGHRFGVDSKEVQDTYVRMDREIEKLLNHLDQEVGKGKYTLFLTADHAAVRVPNYLKDNNIPAGYVSNSNLKTFIDDLIQSKYNLSGLVENISNEQIFLNRKLILAKALDLGEVADFVAQELVNFPTVYKAISGNNLQKSYIGDGILGRLQRGYNQKYSGDILYINMPSFISYGPTGSTHGSGYNYDTHIPMVFFGNGIKSGGSSKEYYPIIDLVPTISRALDISLPNGSSGKIISEVLK